MLNVQLALCMPTKAYQVHVPCRGVQFNGWKVTACAQCFAM